MTTRLEDYLTAQDLADLETGREMRRLEETQFVEVAHMACLLLIRQSVKLNARKGEYTEGRVTVDGQPEGTWKITVEEVESEEAAEGWEVVEEGQPA